MPTYYVVYAAFLRKRKVPQVCEGRAKCRDAEHAARIRRWISGQVMERGTPREHLVLNPKVEVHDS